MDNKMAWLESCWRDWLPAGDWILGVGRHGFYAAKHL